jgi:hypothetical protein
MIIPHKAGAGASAPERNIMANKKAKEALSQVKMQAASEVGVNLNQGYNGDLTARQAGSIGGQMVKKIKPIRTLIFHRKSRIVNGRTITVRYEFELAV